MKDKMNVSTKALIVTVIAAAAIIPVFFTENNYYMNLFIMLGIYVILGNSMNLLLGYAGLVSLGMASFYGIGAYTAALLVVKLGWPFVPSLIAAIVLCFITGLLLGLPSIRLNHIHLAITTGGLNIILVLFINNQSFTGGASGLSNIPPLRFFENKLLYYYLTLVIVLIVMLISYRIVHSKTGRALTAIRGNSIAAAAVGINVNRYKLIVFAISAAMCGLAGVLYAFNIRYIQADAFSTNTSIKILTMGIIGGMGDLGGGVVGALLVGLLPEFLRDLAKYQLVLYGALVVIILRFMPKGIIHPLNKFGKWILKLFSERFGKREIEGGGKV